MTRRSRRRRSGWPTAASSSTTTSRARRRARRTTCATAGGDRARARAPPRPVPRRMGGRGVPPAGANASARAGRLPALPVAARTLDGDPRGRLRRGRLREPLPVARDRPAAPQRGAGRSGRAPARRRSLRGRLLHLAPRRLVRRARAGARAHDRGRLGRPHVRARRAGATSSRCSASRTRARRSGSRSTIRTGRSTPIPSSRPGRGRCSTRPGATRREHGGNLFADVLAAERQAGHARRRRDRPVDGVRARVRPLALRAPPLPEPPRARPARR